MPLSSHPPHLMRWFNEFLEMCNRDGDLIKKLQNEKASLMAEVEDLKTKEEKNKIAKTVLMAEKEDAATALEKMAKERETVRRALLKEEENHKVAHLTLSREKDNELQERANKAEMEMKEKVERMEKEKVEELQEMKKGLVEAFKTKEDEQKVEMQTEIKKMMEQLIQSKSENQELFANFKTMEKKYNSFKEFFQRVIQFAPTNL